VFKPILPRGHDPCPKRPQALYSSQIRPEAGKSLFWARKARVIRPRLSGRGGERGWVLARGHVRDEPLPGEGPTLRSSAASRQSRVPERGEDDDARWFGRARRSLSVRRDDLRTCGGRAEDLRRSSLSRESHPAERVCSDCRTQDRPGGPLAFLVRARRFAPVGPVERATCPRRDPDGTGTGSTWLQPEF
jgi:hypothetical protein